MGWPSCSRLARRRLGHRPAAAPAPPPGRRARCRLPTGSRSRPAICPRSTGGLDVAAVGRPRACSAGASGSPPGGPSGRAAGRPRRTGPSRPPPRRAAGAAGRHGRRRPRLSASIGTMPSPTSLETSTTGPASAAKAASSRVALGLRVALRQQDVGEPQGQAVDEHGTVRAGARPPAPRQFQRLLDGQPVARPPLPVMRGSARAISPSSACAVAR